jgi:hypothetical protein
MLSLLKIIALLPFFPHDEKSTDLSTRSKIFERATDILGILISDLRSNYCLVYFEANIPFRLFLQNQSNVKNSFNSNLRNEATPAIVILFSTECILFFV